MDVMSFEEFQGLFKWLIESYDVGFDQDFKYSFHISLKETNVHIGWVGIGVLDFNTNIKEIYYLIGRQY
jgi:ribosomal-protein-alanine N-acetyltransferase